MATIITGPSVPFGYNPPAIPVLAQEVYAKAAWGGAWQRVPYLHCLEAAAGTLPTFSTATLQWRYGYIEQTDQITFTAFARSAARGLFLKIPFVFPDPNSGASKTITWYGGMEIDQDEPFGSRAGPAANLATGVQTFSAYGLEYLLDRRPIIDARWNGSAYTTEKPPDFNANGKPNRTKDKHDGTYIFEPKEEEAEYWSTLDVIDYLHGWQTSITMVFDRAADAKINGLKQLTWDRPTVRQHGRTVWSIINELVSRKRMLSAWYSVNEGSGNIELCTNTLTDAAITIDIPNANDIPANNRKVRLQLDDDYYSKVSVKHSGISKVHQVICRGAEIRCVGTFGHADETLGDAWEWDLENDYMAGASNEADYTDWTLEKQRQRNAEVRTRPELTDVFCRYEIFPDYDFSFQVGDGVGGDKEDLFPEPHSYDDEIKPFWPDMVIDRDLPLLQSVDYSGSVIEDDTIDEEPNEDGKPMPPLVFLRKQEEAWVNNPSPPPSLIKQPEIWVRGEDWGATSEISHADKDGLYTWSAFVEVPPKSHTIRVVVSGAPQHALEASAFNQHKLLADEEWGDLDPSDSQMVVTLSLPAGRFCEGRYPTATPTPDYLRRKVFELGPDYTATYVAPNTAVGVDDAGALLRSDGGWIPKISNEDNFTSLRMLAKQLYHYYYVDRYIIDLESASFWPTSKLGLGDLVLSTGNPGGGHYRDTNSFVSEISIQHPQGDGDSRPAPKYHLVTWAGELTPIRPAPA